MKTWITADYHLGEDRFKIMNRPFETAQEMVDTLVENHNKLVASDDLVYIVGDVVYQKAPEFLEQVSRFNGTKILCRGNHDRVFTDEDLKPYFEEIYNEGEYTIVNGYALNHYPTRGRKDYFNLVGHVHGAWRYQLNMMNIGVDTNHFYPYDMNHIQDHVTAISKFYDDDVWVAYDPINMKHLNLRGKDSRYLS